MIKQISYNLQKLIKGALLESGNYKDQKLTRIRFSRGNTTIEYNWKVYFPNTPNILIDHCPCMQSFRCKLT